MVIVTSSSSSPCCSQIFSAISTALELSIRPWKRNVLQVGISENTYVKQLNGVKIGKITDNSSRNVATRWSLLFSKFHQRNEDWKHLKTFSIWKCSFKFLWRTWAQVVLSLVSREFVIPNFLSWYSVIVRVREVLKQTVAGNRSFDSPNESHLHSQV